MDKFSYSELNKILTNAYDFQGYTNDEVFSKIAQKINIIIEHFNYIDNKVENEKIGNKEKFDYLLGQGLDEKVAKMVLSKITDGTLGDLINNTLLGNVNKNITDFKMEVGMELLEKVNKDDIGHLTSTTPVFVNSISEMNDKSKIYVNLTDGYVYIYNKGNFVKTNVLYQALGISNNSISYEHIKNNDSVAISNLNSNNLFKNVLMKENEKGWNLSSACLYTPTIKIDNFPTITIRRNDDDINTFFYQSITDLIDNTEYFIRFGIFCTKETDVRLTCFYYKNNQHIKSEVKNIKLKAGINYPNHIFVANNKIANDYRIAISLLSNGEISVGKPYLTLNSEDNKNFCLNDGIDNLKKYTDNIFKENHFNPNNISKDKGIPNNWQLQENKTKLSDIEIDGYKTLKMWADGVQDTIPYKVVLFDKAYNGNVSSSLKIKVEKLKDDVYPIIINMVSIKYPFGASTGGTPQKKQYIIEQDGIYDINITQEVVNCGRVHVGLSTRNTDVNIYFNQLTIVLDDTPQPHTLNEVYKNSQKANLNGYVVNPLYKKSSSWNGDSIMQGIVNNGGFARIIAERNEMGYSNIAIGGGTIASETYYLPENYPQYDKPRPRHWICKTIQNMVIADYNILEGGINDFWNKVPLGEITKDYNSEFDETTFCGAFESMLKQAILRFDGKKYGFIITHKITNTYYPYGNQSKNKFELYYNKMIEILEKWSFPYLDLFKSSGFNGNIKSLRDKYTTNGDGTHFNDLGYRVFMVDKVENWLLTL